ncbi:MAG: hypothetical protein JWQ81_6271 [Amycolatopsis sp.]|uniref:helicase-associated domain-containing protein n=1 Tax=Amycolatopsis sp. TaxID=37632 RepID=UPI0026141385|nr:helicase-associated domain-containing protein [Amycolatopsis sp.]MCU1685532.1 hypothetical protein [Amycolatopsis sp.]
MQYTEPGALDERLLNRLAGLSKEKLAQVLENRPDVLEHPYPRRLGGVVARLCQAESLEAAAGQLTTPAVQVLCAAQLCAALGDDEGITVSAVASVLGASVSEVTAAVDQLSAFAFAWLEGGSIRLPALLQTDGYARYGLGQPLAPILSRMTVHQLQETARALDLPMRSLKQALVDEVLEFFRDGNQVRELAASGPEGSTELLEAFVQNGPELPIDLGMLYDYRRPAEKAPTPELWAVKRCLLVATFEGDAHMPLEVGLALRGADYKLPFTPEPPAVPVTTIASEQLAAETSAAALRLLDRVTTLVEKAGAEPLPRLKNGTVGTRVIKKLAKDAGATTDEITLALDLAVEGELLEAEPPPPPPPGRRPRKPPPEPPTGLVPGEQFAHWRAGTSATRLRHLVEVWWTTPIRLDGGIEDVRDVIIRLLTELGPGAAPLDVAKFAELVAWHAPMVPPDAIPIAVSLCFREAALIGAVAGNAAAGLAQAFVSGLGLAKATEELVASAWATALFGTDLTAIVTGPPSTELTALLDRAADRESQGSASTWRFSPTSVRRAFDNGDTAAALTKELAAVAHGDLPQPLVYLINDVARRHGEVEVLEVGSVVIGENPGLLAEIAAHRRLAKFALRVVAPTVLTSSADAVTTLAALRDAGYAPMHRAADGTIAVRAATVPVVTVTPEPEYLELPESEGREDPFEHAERLLREPRAAGRPLQRGKLLGLLPGDRSNAWMRLTWQLEAGFPVWIVYDEPDGGKRKLLVANPELHGDQLDVWCHDPGTYRKLELSRIVPGQD